MKKILLLTFLFSFSNFLYAEDTIIIGLDADMSAVAAEGGLAIQRGAQIAIDEINAQGGVLNRPLQLAVRDHRGNPARGVANIRYFAEQENVAAVLGGVHTPVALHELPLIHEKKMIYLGPWAAGTGVVDNGFQPNYVFRVSVRDAHAGHVLIKQAKKRGYKRVGLLLERTGWGRSNEKSMGLAAKQQGLSVVAVEWFSWREPSMKPQIDTLLNNGAEVVLLVANAPEGAAVVQEFMSRPEAERLPILSHWGIASGAFVKKVGLDALAKVDLQVLQTYSFLQPYDEAKQQQLMSAYKKQFDPLITSETIPAPVGTAHAYDLVHMLAQAIVQANTIEREQVRTALEGIESYQGLVKHYIWPFTEIKHDALDLDDYHLARYNERGYLVPVDEY